MISEIILFNSSLCQRRNWYYIAHFNNKARIPVCVPLNYAVIHGVLACFFFFFLCVCVCLFRAAPEAYGDSQTRGRIRAVAESLCHSHSNARSLTH